MKLLLLGLIFYGVIIIGDFGPFSINSGFIVVNIPIKPLLSSAYALAAPRFVFAQFSLFGFLPCFINEFLYFAGLLIDLYYRNK